MSSSTPHTSVRPLLNIALLIAQPHQQASPQVGPLPPILIHVPVIVQVKGLILYSARMEFPCLFYQQPFFKCELRHAARAFFRAKVKEKTTEEEEENISEKSNTSIKSRRKATISMGRRTTKLPSLLSQVPPYHQEMHHCNYRKKQCMCQKMGNRNGCISCFFNFSKQSYQEKNKNLQAPGLPINRKRYVSKFEEGIV